jgi:hypothetical protein
MLIALLAILGVDLIVLVAVAALVFGRRRWLKRQPGEFVGAVRLTGGEIEGFGPKWKRGSGRWVRDVFVWSKAPFMFRNELLPIDRQVGERRTDSRDVKRLGEKPVVVEFAAGDAVLEVATKAEQRDLVIGHFAAQSTPAPAP